MLYSKLSFLSTFSLTWGRLRVVWLIDQSKFQKRIIIYQKLFKENRNRFRLSNHFANVSFTPNKCKSVFCASNINRNRGIESKLFWQVRTFDEYEKSIFLNLHAIFKLTWIIAQSNKHQIISTAIFHSLLISFINKNLSSGMTESRDDKPLELPHVSIRIQFELFVDLIRNLILRNVCLPRVDKEEDSAQMSSESIHSGACRSCMWKGNECYRKMKHVVKEE